MSGPVGVCVKAAALRPTYDNLAEYLADPGNVLVCRYGRVWITKADGTKSLFSWRASPFANPFRVGQHTVEQCLVLYRAHLMRLLENAELKAEFHQLATRSRIGCFCAVGAPCHRDIILELLRAEMKN